MKMRRYVDNPSNRRLGRVGKPIEGGQGGSNEIKKQRTMSTMIDDDDLFTIAPENISNNNSVAEQPIDVRMSFLRKVYSILTVQLVTMVAVATFMVTSEEITSFVQTNPGIMIVAMLLSLVCMIALKFKERETPTNYLLLAIFTLLESYLVGVIVTLYTIPSVIQCLGITLGLFVGLTLFSMQSQRDFTSLLGPLILGVWFMLISYIVMIFFPMPAFEFGLAVFGAVVFCALIVVDTQLIMRKVSEEDYILAVVMLYLDVVNLFMNILRIFGDRRQ